MGYPKPDAEKAYLDTQLGNQWQRLLSNGQIFNWFADYAAHQSKIDREKIVKRLRVFSSRDEDPTAFWVILMTRFYEEGAHLGLRKYVENGVTYRCPPQFAGEFKDLCKSAPSANCTVVWCFRPDYLSGWIFAHVFTGGAKKWFKKSWPEALVLRDKRYLVSYYPAGAVNELSDVEGGIDDEATLEGYQSCHSLLGLIFGTTSPAAFNISVDDFASELILKVVEDPYLGVSSSAFNDAAINIAGMCVKPGLVPKSSPFRQQVEKLLKNLGRTYSHLESSMIEDADYMHRMTYPLMPLSKKSNYGALMADFETALKTIVIEHTDEIAVLARKLTGKDDSIQLFAEVDERRGAGPYSVQVVRQYLANCLCPHYMPLEAFDVLRQLSDEIKGDATEVIEVADLKSIVRERVGKLTDSTEVYGAFLITGPLMVALQEVGAARSGEGATDYADLFYRNSSDHPWLCTYSKFAGETENLERERGEFLAYCRLITRK